MFRQRTGSVVCASCGSLVGVNDDRCYTCGRRNPGLWGFGPALRRFGNDLGFLPLVVYGCSVLYVASILLTMGRGGNPFSGSVLSMLGPSNYALVVMGASGAIPVFELGRWWTVLSAGWLHGGVLHIVFNMMAVRQLGPAVAELYGAGRMVIVYTIACVTGFLLSSFMGYYLPLPLLGGGGITIGASAPICGLLGALAYYGRRSGSTVIRAEATRYIVGLLVIGVLMLGIDNAAHAGGFVGGYVVSMWLDPLKPERMDHFVGAAVCLLASALSIVWSVVSAYI